MIQAVERAAKILECFETQDKWGISELSAHLGLNKSTVFGLVNTLAALGYLEQDEATGRYGLGVRLFLLGQKAQRSIRQLVQPQMTALARQLEETVNFVKREGDNVVYLVKQESPHSMRICTNIGQRLPMYCSAVGKAILAYLPAQEQQTIARGYTYHRYTEHTLPSPQALLEDLEAVRREGFALDREELEYGLVCLAVPVFDPQGQVAAAVSCSGPKQRMTPEKLTQIKAALQACAQNLSGYPL